MDDDRMSGLARYERYFRYMHLMDTMDMMEGFCDSSIGETNDSPIQNTNPYKRQRISSKPQSNSDIGKGSDEENGSEDNFESDNDDSDESDLESVSFEPPKKKIDLENPYRGLKDSGNPLETMSDVVFLASYKFSKKTVFDVMETIKTGLIKHTNRGSPVPPLIELLITLKYLTTGSVQKDAMDGVSQSTISRINTRVTKLIVALQNQFIKFPDRAGIDRNKMRYYERGKFPEVVGCIGSTHVGVRVKGIKNYNSGFVNENGYHSVRVQVHRLMLKDTERMNAYKTAIMNNKSYIEGKTIMDVGAGSGILSIFCAMAGAKKVYAVEASNIAKLARNVVRDNKMEHIIKVIHNRVEDIILPDNEKVDMIISEWMGFYLLHEGMLDSVFFARDKFLKPDGSMFPESATIYVAPCSVPSMYEDWAGVHGVNMNVFGEYLRRSKNNKPEVMEIEEKHLMGEAIALAWINIKDDTVSDLNNYTMNSIIGASRNGHYQGISLWFVCQFPTLGEVQEPVILSTAPSCPQTHWKQTVIVLPEEQVLEEGEPIAWNLVMRRSEESSRRYDLQLTLLDPLVETHPTPCSCYMTKCIVIKKFLNEQEGEHVGMSTDDDFQKELDSTLG